MTSPYSWNWKTTQSSNGPHTLETKAFDEAGNQSSSIVVSVTVDNTAASGLDISNWELVQANSATTYNLPPGTIIPDNGYVVIGRNATKTAFEAFWGSALPSNAVYINSGGAFPVINGSENYTLYNAAGVEVDGTTISMASSAGQSIQRKDPCLPANQAASWNVLSSSSASPGSGAGLGCGIGVVINEFSDALGTGNFVYEFVELHYDR